MKSAREIEKEQSGESIKKIKTAIDEVNYFKDILSQCNEETFVENFMECKKSKTMKYYFEHHVLKNGLHVYKSNNPQYVSTIIVEEELTMEDFKDYNFNEKMPDLKDEFVGVYVALTWKRDKTFDIPECAIRYYLKDENISINDIFVPTPTTIYWQYHMNDYRKIGEVISEIPDSKELMVDFIDQKIDQTVEASDMEKSLAKDRIHRIYSGLNREDLKTYTPDQLKIMQLEKEVDKLKNENIQVKSETEQARSEIDELRIEAEQAKREIEQSRIETEQAKSETEQLIIEAEQARSKVDNLESENKRLRKENEALLIENNRFKVALDKAREQMHRMRAFIIDRCGKIPFVGKEILKEMNEEIVVNELEAPRER